MPGANDCQTEMHGVSSMFNGRERVALLLLTASLSVGGTMALLDYGAADRFEDFHVVRGAVEVPSPVAAAESPTHVAGEPVKPSNPVALNSATARELERLPLVGPKTAALILQYRRRHGPFPDLESLTQVKGIGPRTLERLRPLIVLR